MALMFGIGLCRLLPAHAQETLRFDQKYIEAIKKSSGISPVAMDAFGDQIDLATGGATFRWTDIDVPGNNALPVRLQRSLVVEDKRHGDGQLHGFGSMGSLDIPYLKGVFSTYGWQVTGSDPNARCSHPSAPPPMAGGKLGASDYWSGNWLHIPWEGDQAILQNPAAEIPRPAGSASLITRNFWVFQCLPSTKNQYPGEGFIARSPSGEKYYFDWVVTRPFGALTKRLGNYGDGKTGAFVASMARETVFFLVTRIEDRFGNWVTYDYDGSNLRKITASDGRFITLTWSGGQVISAQSNLGTWTYASTREGFTVTPPDGNRWVYVQGGLMEIEPSQDLPVYDPTPRCPLPDLSTGTYSLAVTHPSGATATFHFQVKRHFKNNVPEMCNSFIDGGLTSYKYLTIPNFSDTFTLVSKTVTGIALPAMQWTYSYTGGGPFAFEDVCSNPPTPYACPPNKTTVVRGPDRSYKRYTFGNLYNVNSGQLLRIDEGYETGAAPDVQVVIQRSKVNSYITADDLSTQPFPDCVGSPGSWSLENIILGCLRPQKERDTTQDGVTFSASTTAFDKWARPLSSTKHSSLGYTRTDKTSYYDNASLWILGQIARRETDGVEVSEATFDPATALPTAYARFGKPQQSLTYNLTTGTQDGTIATVKDGNGHVTRVEDWHRGVPRKITFADNRTISAQVLDTGWIASVTDENGYKTCYAYDAMGRVKQITYPSETQMGICDTSRWAPTKITFQDGYQAAYGVPAGHWRQITYTGRGRKLLILDALWRPVVEQALDLDDVPGTDSETIKRYDGTGRMVFESYPMNTGGAAAYSDTGLRGVHTSYDSLDRPVLVAKDSEIGSLHWTTRYLSGFQAQVTDPRNNRTITAYQAFDQPTTEWPVSIVAADGRPEETQTLIERDVFGKPLSLTRRNAAGTVAATRAYDYNAAQELCKTVEPETDATLMGYDGAGNLQWSAAGLPPGTVCSATGNTAAILARKAVRSYDPRDRLLGISYADHRADVAFSYTPDGKLETAAAYNGGTDVVTTTYTYNRRRLMTGERMVAGSKDLRIGYGYDSNGNLSSLAYPSGLVVPFDPNGLGQPGRAGTYATGVTYYPNGGIRQFTYGNGIVHTLAQNERGLPERSRDAYGSTAYLDDSYDYDGNGNVAAISDGLTGHRGDRTMTYDGLDRLLTTASPMFAGAVATYRYDALDNLTAVKAPGRDQEYIYDAHWRLTNVVDAASGSTVVGLGYDEQGNVNNKKGMLFDFDLGNRLRGVSGTASASYIYDAHGRRVRDITTGPKWSLYSNAGQLLYVEDDRTGSRTSYIYLGGSLVAQDSNVPPVGMPQLSVPASSTTGAYTVQWTAATNAERYEVQEQADGGSFAGIYSGTGLSVARSNPDGTYGYRVRACTTAGCGNWSATATVLVTRAPTEGPGITAPASGLNGSYTISWTAVPLADRYVLQESGNAGGSWATAYSGSARQKAFAGHAAGSWSYRAQGCNANGCGPWSAMATVQVFYPPATAPALSAPASDYDGAYTVSWAAVNGASSYSLEEGVNGGTWRTAYSGGAVTKTFSGKSSGGYAYRAKACNAAGCGPASAAKTVQVTLPPASAPVPSAPALSSTGSYTVSWAAVAGASSYALEERFNSGSWTGVYSGSALSKALSGRSQGTYAYRLRACNAAGCSPNSATRTMVVDFRPAAPTLTLPSSTTSHSFPVKWTSSATATSYRLEQSADGGAWTVAYSGTALSVSLGRPNATYRYRVQACNGYGCGAYSAIRTITVDWEPCRMCIAPAGSVEADAELEDAP
ncbi:MAG TPA: RHS repeat protein [Xanthomonadaceae bacterium]|nr:RHS repeat protein [Xanthomonadaceae bacterium]